MVPCAEDLVDQTRKGGGSKLYCFLVDCFDSRP